MRNISRNRFFPYIKNPSWLVVSSFTLGALVNHYWEKIYPSPKNTVDNLEYLFKTDEKNIVPLLSNLPKTTRHSLACYFIHELTMFGEFIENHSEESKQGQTRLGFFATPYAWSPTGVVSVPVQGNSVLMVQDQNKQKIGHNPILNFPQGYTNHGNQDLPSITRRIDMDSVEEAILKNKGGLAPYKNLHFPQDILLTGVPYQRDRHRVDAAIRETQEETGTDLGSDNIKAMRHFGYWEGLICNKRISMFTNYYLIVVNRKNDCPVALDAKEIMSVHSIKFSEIQIEETSKQGFVIINDQRYEISDRDMVILIQGLKAYRNLYPLDPEISIPPHLEAAMLNKSFPGFTVLDQPYPSVEHYIQPK